MKLLISTLVLVHVVFLLVSFFTAILSNGLYLPRAARSFGRSAQIWTSIYGVYTQRKKSTKLYKKYYATRFLHNYTFVFLLYTLTSMLSVKFLVFHFKHLG